ncbi:hypothetical protein EPI10_015835 [Gossypium australe]|uniref:Uncharacterized protein n=1 Tax=Gossypium australe TaxID=47621 RepID=A0A5B6VLF1_9ROSI|nr:hypothetical protein EPI10_015835 [Gossypium australe]
MLDVLKQLRINILLVKTLEQMLNYAKAMKEFLSKKSRFGEFETNKFPPKLKDPKSLTIPCNTGESYYGKVLYNLGSSINLMPMFVVRQLSIGKAKTTTVTLQLADRSLTYLKGKIEDVLVRVDQFIFLSDFITLDFKVDKRALIILKRPFLETGRMIIDEDLLVPAKVEYNDTLEGFSSESPHPNEDDTCLEANSEQFSSKV